MAKRATRSNAKQTTSASSKKQAESKYWAKAGIEDSDHLDDDEDEVKYRKYEESSDSEAEVMSLVSDALDDEDDEDFAPAPRGKRKRTISPTKKASPAKQSALKTPKKQTNTSPRKKRTLARTNVDEEQDGAAYQSSDSEAEARSLDSHALDDDDSTPAARGKRNGATSARKAKKSSATNTPRKKASVSPRKKRKQAEDYEDEEEEDLELEEGQEIVGVVVQAPKTGRVPPGQISRNTLNFLAELKKPECNDREWFKLHEPVYRLAESEWKAFVEEFTDLLVEVDPQIPHLPPKDVIHRIYRDVRFSNDKTPYKTGFSASYSRSGRKGIFAHLKPGGESLIAAGAWCPGKNELQTIRNNLLRSSRRLREVIAAPEFEALFGPARPHPKGARQNVFGQEDELKVAPKGIDKTHKDIDLLKCRSFAVIHKFTDIQVLSPTFKEELANVARVMRPFVHCLNDLMTIPDAVSSDSDDDDQDEGGEDE
ncbi:hypothetical protein FKP32DRAFT_1595808 [Trametes sanguinea]|nr:hypothetical protein FKP32DRAFT_1595808 [Trametes sanguinea]